MIKGEGCNRTYQKNEKNGSLDRGELYLAEKLTLKFGSKSRIGWVNEGTGGGKEGANGWCLQTREKRGGKYGEDIRST